MSISPNLHPVGYYELMPRTLATAVDWLLDYVHVYQTTGDFVRLTQAMLDCESCR